MKGSGRVLIFCTSGFVFFCFAMFDLNFDFADSEHFSSPQFVWNYGGVGGWWNFWNDSTGQHHLENEHLQVWNVCPVVEQKVAFRMSRVLNCKACDFVHSGTKTCDQNILGTMSVNRRKKKESDLRCSHQGLQWSLFIYVLLNNASHLFDTKLQRCKHL